MSRGDPQVMLRLPGDLRARVKAQAARNRRSMNAEIVLMIERGLEKGNAPTAATVGALDVQ
ncbi:Arc family DNA-binding protein [Bordetella bronchiseptica]|nr:Arc family DNA-binding protein [Bordetella bronchiseptica]